jgi:hypothetical protein
MCLHPCLAGPSIVPEVAQGGLEALSGPAQGPGDGEGGGMATYEAYCVKCRTKRQFEGQEVTLKNGRKAAQGQCPVCGTKVMRILGKAS